MKDNVGYIVFSSKDVFDFDIIKSVEDEISRNKGALIITINEFYKNKRTELIKKICCKSRSCSEQEIDSIVIAIDKIAQKRYSLFELSPESITQHVKFFLDSRSSYKTKPERIFNEVFATNINNAIIKTGSEEKLTYYLILLEEIAYFMHKNKDEFIDAETLQEIISNYMKNFGVSVNTNKFLNSILNAKIFDCKQNKYKFTNRNHLSYFIARKISKSIETTGFDCPDVNYLVQNICFGINDIVLMFITYLRSNTSFALNICEKLKEMFDNYEEINFDGTNIRALGKANGNITIPTAGTKEKLKTDISDSEQTNRALESEIIEFRRIYDYKEEDAQRYETVIALKYLEIVSKSLINHFGEMKISDKKLLVDCLYSLPNKVLFAHFKPLDEHYDETLDYLQKNSGLTKEKLDQILVDCTRATCLSVLDHIASLGANDDTRDILQNYDPRTINHKAFSLMIDENNNTTEKFLDKAIQMISKEKDEHLKAIIRLIARKHLLTHDSIKYDQFDRFADKIFMTQDKEKLFLLSLGSTRKNA